MVKGELVANSDARLRQVLCEWIGQGRLIRAEDAACAIGITIWRMNAILSGRRRAYADELLSLLRLIPHEAACKILEGCNLIVDRAAGNDAACYSQTDILLAEANLELAKAREDGHIDHLERPRVHNAFRRLMINLVGHLRPAAHAKAARA